jgi:selenocysteine lyase/cysteine desulfurase
MQPLMRSVKFVPVGIVHHNTADEVDRLLAALAA